MRLIYEYFVVCRSDYNSVYVVNLLMLLWMCVWLRTLSVPCLIPCACIFYLTRGAKDWLIDWLIDWFLTTSTHWTNRWSNCQLAYLEIREDQLSQIVSFFEVTKTFVSSLVLSRLDYCKALLRFSLIIITQKEWSTGAAHPRRQSVVSLSCV